MNPQKGEFLVLRKVRNGFWSTSGESKTEEQANEEARKLFSSGMTEENDTVVVKVTNVSLRDFDPR
jgi:hypothetical protein